MGSIRGPDGIQLREIKWWWIAVGQQRRTLLCVWAHAHALTCTWKRTAEGGKAAIQIWRRKKRKGEQGEERRKKAKDIWMWRYQVKWREQWEMEEGKSKSSAMRPYRGRVWRRERTNNLLPSYGKWGKDGRQERWIERWMDGANRGLQKRPDMSAGRAVNTNHTGLIVSHARTWCVRERERKWERWSTGLKQTLALSSDFLKTFWSLWDLYKLTKNGKF